MKATLIYPSDAAFVRHSKAIQRQIPRVKLATLQTAMAQADDYHTVNGYRTALRQTSATPSLSSYPDMATMERLTRLTRDLQHYDTVKHQALVALHDAVMNSSARAASPLIAQLASLMATPCDEFELMGLEDPQLNHHGMLHYEGRVMFTFSAEQFSLDFALKTTEYHEFDELAVSADWVAVADCDDHDMVDDFNDWLADLFTAHFSPGDEDVSSPHAADRAVALAALARIGVLAE